MKDKILFFSIDRLGDYLIRSNVIKKISENYKNSEIIVSDTNSKLISSQNFFSKIIEFDRKNKNKNKIKFILTFFRKKYDSAICFDGKNISNIIFFIIKANFKHTFIYKKKGILNKIKFFLFIQILNLLNISYTILYSRDLIEKDYFENYPSKYKLLKKYYKNITEDTYYLEKFEINNQLKLNNYILIHLDEKFCDISDIEKSFNNVLLNLSENIDKKIIITAYKNNFQYYKNLSINKIKYNNLHNLINKNEKIIIIEDLPLKEFYDLINNSLINISCHAGFFVHISLYNKKRTIDVINKNEEKWLNTWITDKDQYKTVHKSNTKEKYSIEEIFKEITTQINEIQ